MTNEITRVRTGRLGQRDSDKIFAARFRASTSSPYFNIGFPERMEQEFPYQSGPLEEAIRKVADLSQLVTGAGEYCDTALLAPFEGGQYERKIQRILVPPGSASSVVDLELASETLWFKNEDAEHVFTSGMDAITWDGSVYGLSVSDERVAHIEMSPNELRINYSRPEELTKKVVNAYVNLFW